MVKCIKLEVCKFVHSRMAQLMAKSIDWGDEFLPFSSVNCPVEEHFRGRCHVYCQYYCAFLTGNCTALPSVPI